MRPNVNVFGPERLVSDLIDYFVKGMGSNIVNICRR